MRTSDMENERTGTDSGEYNPHPKRDPGVTRPAGKLVAQDERDSVKNR